MAMKIATQVDRFCDQVSSVFERESHVRSKADPESTYRNNGFYKR